MAKKKKQRETSAPPEESASGMKAIEIAMKSIRKKFGDETVSWVSEVQTSKRDIISTSSLSLDSALGVGGIARGRIYEFYGPNACLDSETFIPYRVVSSEGRVQNKKGGTIEHLYERFNGIEREGSGYYQRPQTIDSDFYTLSVDEEGMVFTNKIVDVVSTGSKECFEVKTSSGATLTATKDHKFLTGNEYVPLEDLRPGTRLMLNSKTWSKYAKTDTGSKEYRNYWYVKEHPVAGEKKVKDSASGKVYTYKRLAQARAVVEADMNGIPVAEYRSRLNDGDLSGLSFLSRDTHVHHLDENFTNDVLSNLVALTKEKHVSLHSQEKDFGPRVTEDFVESITSVGMRRTFDIKMDVPYNNYIANDIVVHNSGKTTLALLVIKEAIKQGHRCLFIDAEHTLDKNLLVSMGIDPEMIIVTRGYTGEDNLDIAERLIATGEFAVCVIDSISALQPAAEANLESFSDQTMGLQPRLMSRMCRTFTSLVSRTNTALVLINQIRANIGGYGNPETVSGGNAIQHHVSGRLRITGGGVKSRQIKNGKGEVIGHRMTIEITKNKLAAPFRSADVELTYGHGFNVNGEILDLGVDMGLIDQAGSYFKVDGELIGQGRAKAIETISTNGKLRTGLLSGIKDVLGMETTPAPKVVEEAPKDEQAL